MVFRKLLALVFILDFAWSPHAMAGSKDGYLFSCIQDQDPVYMKCWKAANCQANMQKKYNSKSGKDSNERCVNFLNDTAYLKFIEDGFTAAGFKDPDCHCDDPDTNYHDNRHVAEVASRPSSYDHYHPQSHDHDDGGSGGLFGGVTGTNLMWGIGGALVGGLLVSALSNHNNNQQYYQPQPMWNNLGPLGQVPGARPIGAYPGGPFMPGQFGGPFGGGPFGGGPFGAGGPYGNRFLPPVYAAGGGYPGVGGLGYYNGGIYNGGYFQPGQYGAGGYNPFGGGGMYNGGYNYGYGASPIYNAPVVLPYSH